MAHVISIASQAGPIVRARRKQAGWSQAELARRLDVAQSRVSEMERHPGRMSLEQLLTVCAVLGLELVLQEHGSKARGGKEDPAPAW